MKFNNSNYKIIENQKKKLQKNREIIFYSKFAYIEFKSNGSNLNDKQTIPTEQFSKI